MGFEVIVMPTAQAELDDAYAWLLSQTVQHSPSWYNNVLDALASLEEFPLRCSLAPESKESSEPIRQLLCGNKQHAYRILFAVRGERVLVYHIRHAARESL